MHTSTARATAHCLEDGGILVVGAHATDQARELALGTAEREHWGDLEAITAQLDQLPERLWGRFEDSDDPFEDQRLMPVSRETAGAMPIVLWTK